MCLPARHEALTAALSEKDAHLALLEVGGVRSSRAAQEVESLKKEKSKLVDAVKRLVTLYTAIAPFLNFQSHYHETYLLYFVELKMFHI